MQKDTNKEEDTLEEEKLTKKQELFCQTFTTKWWLFGNGVQTYIEVYEPDTTKSNWYKTACQSASQILSNIKVCNRINELLESNGLNDVEVDKQHKYLIEQHVDFWTKMRAISEYNKLKWRIIEKIEKWWKWEEARAKVFDKIRERVDSMDSDALNSALQEALNR